MPRRKQRKQHSGRNTAPRNIGYNQITRVPFRISGTVGPTSSGYVFYSLDLKLANLTDRISSLYTNWSQWRLASFKCLLVCRPSTSFYSAYCAYWPLALNDITFPSPVLAADMIDAPVYQVANGYVFRSMNVPPALLSNHPTKWLQTGTVESTALQSAGTLGILIVSGSSDTTSLCSFVAEGVCEFSGALDPSLYHVARKPVVEGWDTVDKVVVDSGLKVEEKVETKRVGVHIRK